MFSLGNQHSGIVDGPRIHFSQTGRFYLIVLKLSCRGFEAPVSRGRVLAAFAASLLRMFGAGAATEEGVRETDRRGRPGPLRSSGRVCPLPVAVCLDDDHQFFSTD